MLDRMAHLEEQREPLPRGHPLAIAILGDRRALDILHHEVWARFGGRAGIEDASDVRVIHHRQRLPLVGKASKHLAGIHTDLHDLKSYEAANGLALFGEV